MAINSTVISGGPTPVFVAAGQQAITTMYFCNVSNAAANLSVYITSTDDSAGPTNDNIIYSQVEITPSDTYVVSTEKLILDNLNTIWAESSTGNVITATVSSFSV